MPSYEQLSELLDPAATVLLTVECQQGVVGPDSALPELAEEARVVGGARQRRPAGGGRARERRPGASTRSPSAAPTAAARTATPACSAPPSGCPSSSCPAPRRYGSPPPIEVADEDFVVRRLHGLSPIAGTDVDALLRNLGCRTLVVTGVSANVAIPNAVFDAVNLGYTAVVPADAIAGVPSDYTPAMIRNTLALVATVTTTDEVLACLERPRSA